MTRAFIYTAPNGGVCSNCNVSAQHFWFVQSGNPEAHQQFCMACAFTKTKATELAYKRWEKGAVKGVPVGP